MKKNEKEQNRKGLDILRGIGITGIVLYHLFPSVFPGGFLGVPLFFVLSGYLMFTTSEHNWKNGNFHIRNYYKKRITKILPALFTMVMAVCCYLTLTRSSRLIGIRPEISSIFLGYNNWWQISQNTSYFSHLTGSSPFTHLWFLAIEIQFYLLWPFVFILYKKCCRIFGSRKMCFIFLILALVSAGKMLFLYHPGSDPSRVYYGTDTMAFPLLLGIFLGASCQTWNTFRRPAVNRTRILFPVFLVTLCILFLAVDGQDRFLYQGGIFFVSLLFACMIILTEKHNSFFHKLPDISLLSLLGKKSYGIYLWHYPLIILALA